MIIYKIKCDSFIFNVIIVKKLSCNFTNLSSIIRTFYISLCETQNFFA